MKNIPLLKLLFLSIILVSCTNTFTSKEEKKEDKILNGKYVSKRKNGKTAKIEFYKEGKLHGIQEMYNKSGNLQNTISYNEGIRSGKSVVYYDSGNEYRVSNYENDKINGVRKKYRRNGKLWSVQSYKNSLPINDLVEYTESGKKKTKPKFIVSQENKINTEGRYLLKLSVKGTYKNAKYFEGQLDENGCFDTKTAIQVGTQSNSKGVVSIFIPQNTFYMKTHHIIAQVKTHANNNYYIYKKVNVAAESI